MNDISPIVGNWYRQVDGTHPFLVVGVDEVEGLIEIQHYDGDIEELDPETWHSLDLESAEPPNDWAAPMDDVRADDLGYTDTGMPDEEWPRPAHATDRSRGSALWEEQDAADELEESPGGASESHRPRVT